MGEISPLRKTLLMLALLGSSSAWGDGKILDDDIYSAAAIKESKLLAKTPNMACETDSSGFFTTDATTTAAEIGYVHGVTSAIQTQLNAKIGLSSLSVDGGSDPLSYNSSTGQFSMPDATNSQNGYLTSADYTTFSAKQDAVGALTCPSHQWVDQFSSPTLSCSQPGFADLVGQLGATQLPSLNPTVILGNHNGSPNITEQLTPTQVTAMLDSYVGDSGSGGTKGEVSAPSAGDCAAGKVASACGGWVVPSGSSGGTWTSMPDDLQATDYTANTSDVGGLIVMSSSSPMTLIVPSNANQAIPIGSVIQIIQYGTGLVTVEPDTGVTIDSYLSNRSLAGQFIHATLKKTATNEWFLWGENLINSFITATCSGCSSVTTSGNFKIGVMDSSTNFVISSGTGQVEQYIIGSGGGGGNCGTGGAGPGGSGAQPVHFIDTLGPGTYAGVVGAGVSAETDGNDSTFNGHTSTHGVFGVHNSGATQQNGRAGVNGSGASAATGGGATGGAGSNFSGGNSFSTGADASGGGSAGCGAAGGNASALQGGAGGDGCVSPIDGGHYAGGGGGGTINPTGGQGIGGLGGAGNGGKNVTNGADATGPGSGGGGCGSGANGGASIHGRIQIKWRFQ